MRWPRYVTGVAVLAVLAWSAIAIAQNVVEREARALLEAWVKAPPKPFTEFKYGDVNFDLAQRRLTIVNVELTGAPDIERVSIESVSIVDPQPFALDNVINPARYKGGKGQGDFVQVASLMQLRDIRVEASDGETAIAAVDVGAVALRQFAVAPTAANLDGDVGKAVGIIAPGIRVAEILVNSFRSKDAGGAEGFSVARLTMRGIDAGRIEETRIDELRFFDNDKDAVTVGSLMVAGFDLTRALPDLAAGRPVSATDPDRKPQFDRWELLALGGEVLSEQGISLARISADVTRSADRTTERVNFRVDGIELTIPARPGSPVAGMLAGLGYPALKGTIACVSDSDNSRRSWKVEPCALFIPGAGSLSLTYALSGVDISASTGSDSGEALLESLAAASFDWVRVVYKDEGLTNRALAFAAQSSGQPEHAYRQSLAEQVRQGADAYGGGSLRVRTVVSALLAFLDRPGTLTLSLEPAAPVAFGSLDGSVLADPAAAAERLGLTGRHAP